MFCLKSFVFEYFVFNLSCIFNDRSRPFEFIFIDIVAVQSIRNYLYSR